MHCSPPFPPLSQHVDHLLGQEEEDQSSKGDEPSPDEDGVIPDLVVTVVAVAS